MTLYPASHAEKGFTLIELMFVIAIVALMTSFMVWGYSQTSTTLGSDTVSAKNALRAWAISAMSNDGALLTVQKTPNVTLWVVQGLGVNPETRSYSLPGAITLFLNGEPISCAAMNSQGLILSTPSCSTSLQGNVLPEWSIQVGGQNETV